jgi:hypothetical protein
MKRMGGIVTVMIKAITTALPTELHRLTLTLDAFFFLLPVNGNDDSLLPPVSISSLVR